MGGKFMNDVDKFLKKNEVARERTDASANQNAVESPILKSSRDNRRCCLAIVNQTMLYVMAKCV
jgi:hypothetical protein